MIPLMTEAFRSIRQNCDVPQNVPLTIEWTQPADGSPLFDSPLVPVDSATTIKVYESLFVDASDSAQNRDHSAGVKAHMQKVIDGHFHYHQADKVHWKVRSADRVLLFSPKDSAEEREIIAGALSCFEATTIPWGKVQFENFDPFSHMAHGPDSRCRVWFDTFKREPVPADEESLLNNFYLAVVASVASDPRLNFSDTSAPAFKSRMNERLMQALSVAQLSFDKSMHQALVDAIAEVGSKRKLGIVFSRKYTPIFNETSQRMIAPRMGSWYKEVVKATHATKELAEDGAVGSVETEEVQQVFSPYAPEIVVYPSSRQERPHGQPANAW